VKALGGQATTRDAVHLELVSEVLRLSGSARIRVFGGSMLPSVLPGDVLIIHRAGTKRPALGDIIVFARYNRFFAHRVIEEQDRNGITCFVTSGDSLADSDPPVLPHELLGRVSSVVRSGHYFDPRVTLFSLLGSVVLRNSEFLKRCFLWLLRRRYQLSEFSQSQT
jgi:signal peptidase I